MDINNKQQANNASNPTVRHIKNDSSLLFSAHFPEVEMIDSEINSLLSTDPGKCIELLLSLVKKYPDEPMLAYHLANAYQSSGDESFAKQIEEDNYRKFPYFSLIRCSYVDKCLQEGNVMQAAAALDYTFSLSDLYPKRSTFHTMEVVIFESTLIRYFCKIKDFERAVNCIARLRAMHKDIPILQDLQNTVVICILQQNLSPQGLNSLFGFDENKDEDK